MFNSIGLINSNTVSWYFNLFNYVTYYFQIFSYVEYERDNEKSDRFYVTEYFDCKCK